MVIGGKCWTVTLSACLELQDSFKSSFKLGEMSKRPPNRESGYWNDWKNVGLNSASISSMASCFDVNSWIHSSPQISLITNNSFVCSSKSLSDIFCNNFQCESFSWISWFFIMILTSFVLASFTIVNKTREIQNVGSNARPSPAAKVHAHAQRQHLFLAHPKSPKNAHFISHNFWRLHLSSCKTTKSWTFSTFLTQKSMWKLTAYLSPHPSVTAKVHSVSLLKGTGTSLINRTWANYSESWAEFQFNLLNKLSNSQTKASVDAADTAKKNLKF